MHNLVEFHEYNHGLLVMPLFVKTKLTLSIRYCMAHCQITIQSYSVVYRMYGDELWTTMLVHHCTHQTIKLVCDAIESKLYLICSSIE